MGRKFLGIISWTCLAVAFVFLIIFLCNHAVRLTNSDVASEMILGKLLSEEKAVITPNWYYSTELRVLNISLIYAVLFRLFSNWTVIRILTSAICYLLMLACYYYMLYQLGAKKYFAPSAVLLLLPISDVYFEYVLLEILYTPFISSSFLAFGMMFHYGNTSRNGRRILLAAIAILALLSGLGGVRHVVILYLPMLVAALGMTLIKRKPDGCLVCAVTSFIASGIGYLINAGIFAKSYHFSTWSDVRFQTFSFDGIFNIFFGVLRVLGYSYGDIKTPLLSAFSCLLMVVIVVCVIKNLCGSIEDMDEIGLLSLYIVCAFVIFGGIYTFTNMTYGDRYGISVIMLALPVVFTGAAKVKWNRYVKMGGVLLLVGGVLAGSIYRYDRHSKIDQTEELREITDYLVKEKISEGYATFWNGNVLTELSNGFIDVYCWIDDVSKLSGENDLLPWLQKTSHMESCPTGRLFILLTQDEYEECSIKGYLDEEEAGFESENYLCFVFESYEDFTSTVQWER